MPEEDEDMTILTEHISEYLHVIPSVYPAAPVSSPCNGATSPVAVKLL